MMTAMHYPCNYGYIPHTLSDDGDPVDVLVITPVPVTVVGWGGPEEARAEIMAGVARCRQARPQPKF